MDLTLEATQSGFVEKNCLEMTRPPEPVVGVRYHTTLRAAATDKMTLRKSALSAGRRNFKGYLADLSHKPREFTTNRIPPVKSFEDISWQSSSQNSALRGPGVQS